MVQKYRERIFENIKEEYKEIVNDGENLSEMIGKKIIRYIENGEYDKTCKYCEKYINSS